MDRADGRLKEKWLDVTAPNVELQHRERERVNSQNPRDLICIFSRINPRCTYRNNDDDDDE